jgi:hypothetical protein
VLSPKFEQATAEMVDSAPPKSLRKSLKRQLTIFHKGVELLKDAGVPDSAIQAIAETDLTTRSDPEVADEAGVSQEMIDAAAKK